MGSTDSRPRSEVLRALRTGDEQASATAAAALGRRRDVKAVAGLIEAARSRRLPETIDALAAIGDPAIPGLLRALARSDPLFAQQALARMGKTSTPYLISALRSPNRQVRALAAATLGVSEDPAAPEVLLAELKRPPFPIDLHNALVRSIIHHRPLTAAVLVEMVSLIDVAGPETHAAVVDAAGFTLDPRFIAPLTRVLADEGRCRSWPWAARSLGFLAGDAVELGVIDVLVSRARELREGWPYRSAQLEAIQALGRLGDPAGQEVLIQLAGLAIERPVLAPASASRDEVDRSLHDQTFWNVKVTARSALAHLKDSSAPLNPPAGEMGPIMPPGATPEVPPNSAGGG